MAARARVEERRQVAVKRIQEHAAALSGPLGIDATSFLSPFVKGDPAYQEMTRTEELERLLGAVRAKVAPQSVKAEPQPPKEPPQTPTSEPFPPEGQRIVPAADVPQRGGDSPETASDEDAEESAGTRKSTRKRKGK
jgi:hypothetical protein